MTASAIFSEKFRLSRGKQTTRHTEPLEDELTFKEMYLRHRSLQPLDSTLTVWQGRELGSMWVLSNSTIPWVKQGWAHTTACWRCCGLHCSDDLMSLLPPVNNTLAIEKNFIPSGLKSMQETHPCAFWVALAPRCLHHCSPACTECCSVLTHFMQRKSFSPCGIPASHCLTRDMNLQHFLPSWQYSALFTLSHKTSALIVLI